MGYSKAETEKKQRKLVSKTQRNTRKVLVSSNAMAQTRGAIGKS
jgi:hypothetical protein